MVRRVIGFVRRILPSLGIVAVGMLLSATIFTVLRRLESKNAEASFNGVAQQRLDALETNVTLTVNNLVTTHHTGCDRASRRAAAK
jgi:CHASE1-domain containing sensor protein